MSRWELLRFWQTKVIVLTFLLCLLAPLWVNDRPLLSIDKNGDWYFPVFNAEKIHEDFSNAAYNINTIVAYGPGKGDFANTGFKGPFDQQYCFGENGELKPMPFWRRHWFGTDLRGSDVLAYTVYGLRNSMMISLIGLMISLVLAAILGFSSGWYFKDALKVERLHVFLLFVWLILMLHGVSNLYSATDKFLYFLIITVFLFIPLIFRKRNDARKKLFRLKVDFLSNRLTELFIAIPRLIIMMVLIQYFERSVFSLALVIGLTGWMDLARLIRSETIRIKEQPFVDAAKMNGMENLRLFVYHILPNIMPSLMVVTMYTFSSNVVIESSMSFFGLGLPPAEPSIGTLLSDARTYYEYWWLFLLPGIWLSVLIYALFSLPERLGAAKMLN